MTEVEKEHPNDWLAIRLEREIDRLRRERDDAVSLAKLQRRVIARLLDGYHAMNDRGVLVWAHPDDELSWPVLSDGEAAIIRNHQEKT